MAERAAAQHLGEPTSYTVYWWVGHRVKADFQLWFRIVYSVPFSVTRDLFLSDFILLRRRCGSYAYHTRGFQKAGTLIPQALGRKENLLQDEPCFESHSFITQYLFTILRLT